MFVRLSVGLLVSTILVRVKCFKSCPRVPKLDSNITEVTVVKYCSHLKTSPPTPMKAYAKFLNHKTTSGKKLKLLLLRPTDRRTNIVTYRAAIAAKINHSYPKHNS